MKYLYDLHMHTKEGSDGSPVKDMAAYYHEMGYAGFCVTDHLTGSSAVPEGAPWKDRVDRIWEVTGQAAAEAGKYGLSVFPGLEYSIRRSADRFLPCTGNDFVFLNVSRDWMLDSEDLFDLRYTELFKKAREAGVFIIHAHPFLEAWYMTHGIILCPREVDAVEIYNGHVSDECNERARWYCREYGLLPVAGSDNHTPDRERRTGVATDRRCDTVEELLEAVRTRRAEPFLEKLTPAE
ncbi:MAG: PHP domain-containing protein [Abditibacteriota bacterium]|nr:PHP domain-containing protein [Abditibacteriota bacterium]